MQKHTYAPRVKKKKNLFLKIGDRININVKMDQLA
jgi:hypothetical protein